MGLMIPFIEVLDRAHTGPMCEVKEWDMNVIFKKSSTKKLRQVNDGKIVKVEGTKGWPQND